MKKSYFRPEIEAMTGYTPGEQPKIANLVKLNTNENPYPPSPHVAEAVNKLFDCGRLRRYPDPLADALRDEIAALNGAKRENVIVGNGSDDILTMTFRAFTDPERPLACLNPTYSLYKELAAMQGARVIQIDLDAENFAIPGNVTELAQPANLLIITRPNAPTGNSFDREYMRRICRDFEGVVFFDEAYADFADDNCMEFALEFPNVIVSRTFSKSYSLAGIRMGYAVGCRELIAGLFKVKDSYNLDMLAQTVSLAALKDQTYLKANCEKIKGFRRELTAELEKIGFKVIPSQTNFLFAAPPDRDGERYFKHLRENAIIVRYFKGDVTGRFVRITIGTPAENARLVEVSRAFYAGK